MNIDKKIIRQAIDVWGLQKQTRMCGEECLELALAIGKFLDRERTDQRMEDVISEIADVNIMIAQANIMFDADKIQAEIDRKLERLKSRLEKKEFK